MWASCCGNPTELSLGVMLSLAYWLWATSFQLYVIKFRVDKENTIFIELLYDFVCCLVVPLLPLLLIRYDWYLVLFRSSVINLDY